VLIIIVTDAFCQFSLVGRYERQTLQWERTRVTGEF